MVILFKNEIKVKTLFLDFDGVLHVIHANFEERFSKVYLLEELANDFSFEVVISSTWRLFYDLPTLQKNLKSLGERVVGVTGDTISGPYARYLEIVAYAEENNILEWRALDDALQEFPVAENRLIECHSDVGVGKKQIELLKQWLSAE